MRAVAALFFVAALVWIYWIYGGSIEADNASKGIPTPRENSSSVAGNVGEDI
mgnify:CR=1 FL=1|jgi:hypothetical protein